MDAPVSDPSASMKGPAPSAAPMPPAPIPAAAPDVAQEPVAPSTPPRVPQARTSQPPAGVPGNSPGNSNSNYSNNSNRANARRTNPPSTVRYSAISNNSGTTGALSSDSRPQRKLSTLRSALSKLFGRKKKKGTGPSSSAGDTDRTSSVMPSNHRSDTWGLSRVNEAEPKRSASLPITEFDRALRSHSIGPNDFSTIENVRNSMHGDSKNTTPRRRALTITNSRLFGSPAKRNEFGELVGLSPRPVSAHGRSRISGTDEDPEMIGRAITSDMDAGYKSRRRSRSLSGIDALGANYAHNGTTAGGRRRSDEIRYWRESYGPSYLSPMSSTHPETEGDHTEYGDLDNDDTGVISIDPTQSLAARPVTNTATDSPPQPFNFGSLASMNEMAGMKITQAASLETRVCNVENRADRLERVVEQLCHTVPGFNGGLGISGTGSNQVPRSMLPRPSDFARPPSSYQREARTDHASSKYASSRPSVDTDGQTLRSHMSFGEGQAFIGGLHPPWSAATQPGLVPISSSPHTPNAHSPSTLRPTSLSTVRGAMSMPALSGAAASDAVVANLAAQLELERAERLAVELQLKKLAERVNVLSSTMFAMLRDPQKNRSQERLTPFSTAGEGRLSRTSSSSHLNTPTKVTPPPSSLGFDSKNSPTPVPVVLEPPSLNKFQSSGKTLSVFGDTGDDEDSDRGAESIPEESFMTPREECSPHQYGAFGEQLMDETGDEIGPKRRKAARTLSLSQMTIDKSQRAVV